MIQDRNQIGQSNDEDDVRLSYISKRKTRQLFRCIYISWLLKIFAINSRSRREEERGKEKSRYMCSIRFPRTYIFVCVYRNISSREIRKIWSRVLKEGIAHDSALDALEYYPSAKMTMYVCGGKSRGPSVIAPLFLGRALPAPRPFSLTSPCL